MDASEYQTILGYLQTQEIPSEIKNDRYKKKIFIRKCIYVQDQKLMKVIIAQIIFRLFPINILF